MKEYKFEDDAIAQRVHDSMVEALHCFIGQPITSHLKFSVEQVANGVIRKAEEEGLIRFPAPIAVARLENGAMNISIYDQRISAEYLLARMHISSHNEMQEIYRAYPAHSGWLKKARDRFEETNHLCEGEDQLREIGIEVPR